MSPDPNDDFLEPDPNAIPPEQWSFKTKTPEAIKWAMCPCCGRRPETLDPLPPGWCWDTMEPTNAAVWCPKWIH
jgi:hypothetical protein